VVEAAHRAITPLGKAAYPTNLFVGYASSS